MNGRVTITDKERLEQISKGFNKGNWSPWGKKPDQSSNSQDASIKQLENTDKAKDRGLFRSK
jgi:hypothetical protein